MKVRDAIRLIEANGWYHVSTRGSHRQLIDPQIDIRADGRKTVPRPSGSGLVLRIGRSLTVAVRREYQSEDQ